MKKSRDKINDSVTQKINTNRKRKSDRLAECEKQSFVRSYGPGTLRLSNHTNAEHCLCYVLKSFV